MYVLNLIEDVTNIVGESGVSTTFDVESCLLTWYNFKNDVDIVGVNKYLKAIEEEKTIKINNKIINSSIIVVAIQL